MRDRQRACGEEPCRVELRRRGQAAWRKRNPGYFIEWRAREQEQRHGSEPVEPPRLSAPLSSLPWGMAQVEFGIAGAAFLGSMGRVLVAMGPKDEIRVQVPGSIERSREVDPGVAKDEIGGQVSGRTQGSGEVGPEVPKDEILGVAG